MQDKIELKEAAQLDGRDGRRSIFAVYAIARICSLLRRVAILASQQIEYNLVGILFSGVFVILCFLMEWIYKRNLEHINHLNCIAKNIGMNSLRM